MQQILKIGILSFLVSTAASAAVTFSFTSSGGTQSGTTPFGNLRTYTSGIYSVTASAFSLPGDLSGNFTTAQLNQYNTLGLAVCDQAEGANCGNPLHQIDNSGEFDFVLFQFYVNGIAASVDPTGIFINPYQVWDKDVTYWVGDSNGNLSSLALNTLGMGARIDDDDPGSTINTNPRLVSLVGGNGNALLIGARLSGNNADSSIDRFKIESLTIQTSSVPEPATFGMIGFALVGLGVLRRRVRKG